ncbi:CBR-PQN-47 protein, partial [Aphelenchoides avenae]
MLSQMQQQHGQRLMQQQQLSPNSDFLSYPPQSTPGSHQSQLSPPALNQRQMNQMNFGMPQQNFPLDMFSNEDLGLGLEAPGQKRRRVSDNLPLVKSEHDPRMYPMAQSTRAPSVASVNPMGSSMDEYDENGLVNSRQIRVGQSPQLSHKFAPFAVENWSALYDCTQQELAPLTVNVVADKGFNFSPTDSCFVNQKKNHFQVTVHIEAIHDNPPYYVRAANGELLPITEFSLAFCGAKAEMPTSEIQIRQSQTDRKPIPHDPVKLNIAPRQLTKVTVPRLHFSETTMNNHRKNGRPNPEQKFFLLIVKLIASTPNGPMLVQAYQSDRVIVRASNPGQFEPPESDVAWQRNGGTLHYGGPVAIGTDKPLPDAQLTVLGNIVSTGQTTRPSDRRVKEDITDVDTQDALARLNQVRIVEYNYKPEIAQQWGMNDDERHRVGVIAQELAEVIPDAVRDNGEFLTVDDTRIFYDTVAAAQELYRLTGNLECKIDQVEKISAKLARFAQKRRQFGSMAS